MDSRIQSGPGGQARTGRAAKEHPQHDATMQLGVFAEQLIKPGTTERATDRPTTGREPADRTVRTETLDRMVASERTERTEPAPEPVERSATQKIPIFRPLAAIPSQRGHDRPVFVDASGRRGKKVRWLGWAFGLAAIAFAVALVGSLLGGSASAPGLTIPDDKTDAVTAPPKATASQAAEAPQPKASAKKIVAPTHSVPKAPSSKASKASAPARAPHGATPVTGHSPVNTKASPPVGSSTKPTGHTVSPSGGKTGA
ncbi:hypothetical protein [Streptomyces sp. NBC_00083]|uniref:hypothetical protein n=1 Tax=Streptomyces sp. NBC_00083 TaxID=2975647 RepID=UPI0022556E5D|nr:hypothetical protein [Streptomyces sp. NBC_00083]MCX5382141.1 hypothetical protein [Streptomyces sp. NBC_00083]